MKHMANVSQSEQLNRALEALLASRDSQLPVADSKRAPLLRLAASLRALPKHDFKARLKADLERRAIMASQASATEKKVSYIREGFHTVTPYLIIDRAAQFIDFAKDVFGAQERFRVARPGTSLIMHAEIQLGDSIVEVADSTAQFPARPAAMHFFVRDPDAAYGRAIAAGATSIDPPTDRFYGERSGSVKDAFGNDWYIARAIDGDPENYIARGLHNINLCLHPQGAPALIDFMLRAFGAEEVIRAEDGGVVHYAEIKIGDSVIEIGEAHGPYQPMPAGIHLYVPNVDDVYERAMKAGGVSIQPPADQPYGDRSGGVRDAFGNQWFIATHIRDVHF